MASQLTGAVLHCVNIFVWSGPRYALHHRTHPTAASSTFGGALPGRRHHLGGLDAPQWAQGHTRVSAPTCLYNLAVCMAKVLSLWHRRHRKRTPITQSQGRVHNTVPSRAPTNGLAKTRSSLTIKAHGSPVDNSNSSTKRAQHDCKYDRTDGHTEDTACGWSREGQEHCNARAKTGLHGTLLQVAGKGKLAQWWAARQYR